MNIQTLIKNEIVKIIEDGSYICATGWKDSTTEKVQAMTGSFDTHLTILLRNYKDETVVSVYPWPVEFDNSENPGGQVLKNKIDKLPVPRFYNHAATDLLNDSKVYIVPADLDLISWISSDAAHPLCSTTKNIPTAFFKIKYSEGKSFRDCFESIRSVLIGNCLVSQ